MSRSVILAVFCVVLMAARLEGQESEIHAAFRHEADVFRENCANFQLKKFTGCGEVLFTGQPLHIAVGTIAPGNGVAFGPAFVTHHTPNENWRLNLNADAVVSTNQSWRAGIYGKAIYTNIRPGTTTVGPSPIFNVYTQTTSLQKVRFYGLGQSTALADQTVFGMRETIVGTNFIYPVFKPLNVSVQGEANGRFFDVHGNHGTSQPSIEQLHTEATAPGLTRQPAFAQFGEGVRFRPAILSGHVRFNYLLNFQQFVDAGDMHNSFRRLTWDLSNQFPIYRNSRNLMDRETNGPNDCSLDTSDTDRRCPSISRNREGSVGIRVLISQSFTSRGDVVPFYLQPTLGGSDINGLPSLSSYQDYRFRAPNILLLQGSIEHSIYGPVGAAFLAEAGRVAMTRDDLEFDHLLHSYSAGLTLRAGGFPMIRLMYAWGGREGKHFNATINSYLLGGSSRPSLN